MRKSRFTEEQITMALRQGEAGTPVEEIEIAVRCAAQRGQNWRMVEHPDRLSNCDS